MLVGEHTIHFLVLSSLGDVQPSSQPLMLHEHTGHASEELFQLQMVALLLLSWLALAATHAVSLFVPLSIGRVITKVAL